MPAPLTASGPGSQVYQPPRLQAPLAQAQAPTRPMVRLQSPDEPPASRPAPLVMPTPEQLGLGGTPTARSLAVDWVAVHRRLDSLGCSCFQMEHPADGGCRIICLLPTSRAGQNHRIDVLAAGPPEAVQALLLRTAALARK